MYENESFDDYIRNILGYPNTSNMMNMGNFSQNNNVATTSSNLELERCYPEIYKVVYPMILQRCSKISQPVTDEMIEGITNEIYLAIDVNNEINVNINLQNEVPRTGNRSDIKPQVTKVQNEEIERGDRQIRNRDLRDLIKILIIRELIGRPGMPPPRPRPPFPGGRPPFPGGRPPFPNGRPPMRPREYNEFDIYEEY